MIFYTELLKEEELCRRKKLGMPSRLPVGPFPHYYAIVDDNDFEWLNHYRWTVQHYKSGNSYALRQPHVTPPGESSLMHKMITGFDRTDHINGIGLDNRRENLRLADGAQNQWNSGKSRTSINGTPTSQFKGVWWDKVKNKWSAAVQFRGQRYSLGRFTDEIEAARAYDRQARELFGEFARLNFPASGEQGI